jgi:hypothetical protein
MTLAEAIYRVAAAKFMTERTDGVGPNTVLRVATRIGENDDGVAITYSLMRYSRFA